MLQTVITQFGIPGLIGMALGYWLLGTGVRANNKNIFGDTPWSQFGAAVTGGVVIGFAIWFLIGFILGLS